MQHSDRNSHVPVLVSSSVISWTCMPDTSVALRSCNTAHTFHLPLHTSPDSMLEGKGGETMRRRGLGPVTRRFSRLSTAYVLSNRCCLVAWRRLPRSC